MKKLLEIISQRIDALQINCEQYSVVIYSAILIWKDFS